LTVEGIFAYIGPIEVFVWTTWSLAASGVLYVNHEHMESWVGTLFIQTPQADPDPPV
jgi:hypothetical protein